MWVSSVSSETDSALAISRLERPWASPLSTSVSRGVSRVSGSAEVCRAAGLAITGALARARHPVLLIPPQALWGGMTVGITVAAIAALYPAARAARLSPTEALRSV